MKRVLIVTYYWPPNAGAGVYRWLKMSKFLPEFGWRPVIYTPENPEYTALDTGLNSDVGPEVEILKTSITEPFDLYKRFVGKKKSDRIQTGFLKEEGGSNWKEDLALWVRSNFFIPDARVWWVRPSIAFLKNYVQDHPVDAIVTTGPPHSMHLIGRGVKRSCGTPWIADFRDPWTDIDFYSQLKLTRWADAKHRRQEHSVLVEADRVVTVSWSWAKDLEAIGAPKVEVITNGFDPADIPSGSEVSENWSLVHVGAMSPTRDCPGLWRVLADLKKSDPEFSARFKLRFIGPVDHGVIASLKEIGLGDHIEFVGRLSHEEAMREMQKARILLLPINDTPNSLGILPGKLYEYLSVGRPILAVGPRTGDVSRVLDGEHLLLDRSEVEKGHDQVLRLFKEAKSREGVGHMRFSRRTLAGEYAALLDTLTSTD